MTRVIKEMFRKFKMRPMFWVFLLLLIIYLPTALVTPAENDLIVVVTGVGIDVAPEGVELSILTLLPQNDQSFSDSYRIVSAKGENISLATLQIESLIGKRVDLAHSNYVIFGDELCKQGIKTHIDALIKSNNIGSNAMLLACDKTAKELLKAAKEMDSNSGEKLKDMLYNNDSMVETVDTNIDKFCRDFLSLSRCSSMNLIELDNSQGNGIDISQQLSGSGGAESSDSSTSTGSNSSSGSGKTTINNDGTTYVFKDAKYVKTLSKEQTAALNLINIRSQEGGFKIDNYLTESGNFVDVTYDIKQKTVSTHAKIEDGKAKVKFNVHLIIDVMQVESKNSDPIERLPEKTFNDAQMHDKIKAYLSGQFFDAYDTLKPQDLDCLEIGNTLRRAGAKKYRQFVEGLGPNPNLLQNVDIELNINITMR